MVTQRDVRNERSSSQAAKHIRQISKKDFRRIVESEGRTSLAGIAPADCASQIISRLSAWNELRHGADKRAAITI